VITLFESKKLIDAIILLVVRYGDAQETIISRDPDRNEIRAG